MPQLQLDNKATREPMRPRRVRRFRAKTSTPRRPKRDRYQGAFRRP